MGHQSATDVLLKEVGEAFRCYADKRLRPLLRDSEAEPFQKELAARLLLLQWRSRDAFGDFGEFFCMRLLLDQQSALASYFLDLFAQLDWILHLLMLPGDSHDLPRLVHRIAATCRLLYATHMFDSSRQDGVGSSGEELKRVGQTGRMFSQNALHCRMRQLGFVNLDQAGKSVVSLKEELGRGAFATVYKGVFEADYGMDPKKIVGDPVAVKVFSNCSISDSSVSFGSQLLQSMTEVTHHFSSKKKSPEWMEEVEDSRLAIELGRLVSVRHPNVVTPRGYIGKRSQGDSGLVMEVMDESLHDYLQKVAEEQVRPFGELEMLDLMLEIAQGMRFLHECNLMHRDLKPRNVLLRYINDTEQDLAGGGHRFEVKLADFGLTKLYSLAEDEVNGDINKATHTAPIGTSCYMAPELRRGANAQTNLIHEEKLDIFSFGTTCFNILIGNPDAMVFAERTEEFYEAVESGQWKQQWVLQDPAFPYEDPGFIVTLIGRCWETDPNKRPTFATVCLLLQHRLRCSSSFAKELSFMKDYRTWLKEVRYMLDGLDSTNTTWLLLYSQIHINVQAMGEAIGLEATGKIVDNFELGKKVACLEVVRTYLQAGKNVGRWPEVESTRKWLDRLLKKPHTRIERKSLDHFFETSEASHPSLPSLVTTREWLDHFLERSDSLILIKGEACISMLKLVDPKLLTRYYKVLEVDPKLPLMRNKRDYFNFENDEARSCLQADASLFPLLVSFWSLKA